MSNLTAGTYGCSEHECYDCRDQEFIYVRDSFRTFIMCCNTFKKSLPYPIPKDVLKIIFQFVKDYPSCYEKTENKSGFHLTNDPNTLALISNFLQRLNEHEHKYATEYGRYIEKKMFNGENCPRRFFICESTTVSEATKLFIEKGELSRIRGESCRVVECKNPASRNTVLEQKSKHYCMHCSPTCVSHDFIYKFNCCSKLLFGDKLYQVRLCKNCMNVLRRSVKDLVKWATTPTFGARAGD